MENITFHALIFNDRKKEFEVNESFDVNERVQINTQNIYNEGPKRLIKYISIANT